MDDIYTVDDLVEGMIEMRREAESRGPMTGVVPTWAWLVEQEPALGRLMERCQRLAHPQKAYSNWYGKGNRSGIRHAMAELVGGGRLKREGHPDLYGSDAYDVAYQALLGALERRRK